MAQHNVTGYHLTVDDSGQTRIVFDLQNGKQDQVGFTLVGIETYKAMVVLLQNYSVIWDDTTRSLMTN